MPIWHKTSGSKTQRWYKENKILDYIQMKMVSNFILKPLMIIIFRPTRAVTLAKIHQNSRMTKKETDGPAGVASTPLAQPVRLGSVLLCHFALQLAPSQLLTSHQSNPDGRWRHSWPSSRRHSWPSILVYIEYEFYPKNTCSFCNLCIFQTANF